MSGALPMYLAASPAERAKVDYAFNAMVPRPPQDIDGRQAVIHTWIRLLPKFLPIFGPWFLAEFWPLGAHGGSREPRERPRLEK